MITFAKHSCNLFLTPNTRVNVNSRKTNLVCPKLSLLQYIRNQCLGTKSQQVILRKCTTIRPICIASDRVKEHQRGGDYMKTLKEKCTMSRRTRGECFKMEKVGYCSRTTKRWCEMKAKPWLSDLILRRSSRTISMVQWGKTD